MIQINQIGAIRFCRFGPASFKEAGKRERAGERKEREKARGREGGNERTRNGGKRERSRVCARDTEEQAFQLSDVATLESNPISRSVDCGCSAN